MHTGATILAYELTGNERFLEHAKEQIKTYFTRFESKPVFGITMLVLYTLLP